MANRFDQLVPQRFVANTAPRNVFWHIPTTAHDVSVLFIELGLAVIGLALIARLASRWGFSAIPLYLLAGLAFGNGGLAPLNLSRNFIHIGAEIGILLLLFMLGVEYSPEQLKTDLRASLLGSQISYLT